MLLAWLLGTLATAHADPCLPSLRAMQRAARQHAGLDEDVRWRRRARFAGLLPWVTLRGARALDWDDDRYTAIPDEVGNREVYEVRLSWRLDRLLYDPAEPRLAGVERDVSRARAALDEEVTQLYFRWRRAELTAADDPAKRLDADEAWALLDTRTGHKLADDPGRCPNSFSDP
jgi:hypothetical protein